MAEPPNPLLSVLYSLLLLLLSFPNTVVSVSDQELEAAISALRSQGYNLFGNAIATSDIGSELLRSNSSSAYTLFAATNADLYALDMTSYASEYVRNLRYHVARGRFPHSALRSLPGSSSLGTLLPLRRIVISRRLSPDSEFVTANGVNVVHPGVFYGKDLAVHGLDGIFSLRRVGYSSFPSSPAMSPVSHSPPPGSANPPSPIPGSYSSPPETKDLPFPLPDSYPAPPMEAVDPPSPLSDSYSPPPEASDSHPSFPNSYPPSPEAVNPPSRLPNSYSSPSPKSSNFTPMKSEMLAPSTGFVFPATSGPPMRPELGKDGGSGEVPTVGHGGGEEKKRHCVDFTVDELEKAAFLRPGGGESSSPAVAFYWNDETCLNGQIAGWLEDLGHVIAHRGGPRPSNHASDDSL